MSVLYFVRLWVFQACVREGERIYNEIISFQVNKCLYLCKKKFFSLSAENTFSKLKWSYKLQNFSVADPQICNYFWKKPHLSARVLLCLFSFNVNNIFHSFINADCFTLAIMFEKQRQSGNLCSKFLISAITYSMKYK